MADGDETHEDGTSGSKAEDEHNTVDETQDEFEELTTNDISLPEDYIQEYTELNNTIDQLDLCLSSLEERNDNLFAKLQELLESSREARQELDGQQLSEERENN